ncbi:ABC-three component system protein [Devosia sp. CAU 1758]
MSNETKAGGANLPAVSGINIGAELPSDIAQSDNSVGGHMAARDVIAPSGDYIVNVTHGGRATSQLHKLYKKLSEEAEGDKVLTTFIRQLEVYTRQVADEKVIGLEGKFAAANREIELDMAKVMKESVYADLRENLFSPTYQRIAATLMGKIHESFRNNVTPLVDEEASNKEIDFAVNTLVVAPIVHELSECPDFYDDPIRIVRGMLYFLTGNCHLGWR